MTLVYPKASDKCCCYARLSRFRSTKWRVLCLLFVVFLGVLFMYILLMIFPDLNDNYYKSELILESKMKSLQIEIPPTDASSHYTSKMSAIFKSVDDDEHHHHNNGNKHRHKHKHNKNNNKDDNHNNNNIQQTKKHTHTKHKNNAKELYYFKIETPLINTSNTLLHQIYQQYIPSANNNNHWQTHAHSFLNISNNRSKHNSKQLSKQSEELDIIVVKDMHGEDVIFSENGNGMIFGNPLLINQCQNAFYSDIQQIGEQNWTRILSKQEKVLPWFYSREEISILKSMRKKKDTVWLTDRSKAQSTGYKNPQSSTYFNIEKTASTTMTHICQDLNGFSKHSNARGAYVPCKCGFTVVRDPLTRFISGYYTVNRLMWKNEQLGEFPSFIKFWKVIGEPARFRQFVEDMSAHVSEFHRFGALMHLKSQTSILALGQYEIHFILKFEKLFEHYNLLADFCNLTHIETVEEMPQRMVRVGTKTSVPKNEPEPYKAALGFSDDEVAVLDPAWYALDMDTYLKIVEFYKQDYICFKYAPDYRRDVVLKINNAEKEGQGR